MTNLPKRLVYQPGETCWVTDLHVNHISSRPGAVREIGKSIRSETLADTLIITGDISEGNRLIADVRDITDGWKSSGGKSVIFVPGNHDYYRSGFQKLDDDLRLWCSDVNCICLNDTDVITGDKSAIIGNSGWYDANCGNPGVLGMSDWMLIDDYVLGCNVKMREQIIDLSRRRAKVLNEQITSRCQRLITDGITKITICTHVPPWKEAAWHQGGLSDDTWAPWMTNLQLGRELNWLSKEHPDVCFNILCGHTHSPGNHQIRDNLKCMTGRGQYGYLHISGFVDV